jgi:PAS domain-containing protein
MIIFDPDTEEVLEVNRKACELYGCSREQFIGIDLKTLSSDPVRGIAALAELCGKGDLRGFETVHTTGQARRYLLRSVLA